MTLSESIPMSMAASVFCETASIAFPSFVLFTRIVVRIITTIAEPRTMIWLQFTTEFPIVNLPRSMTPGNGRVSAVKKILTASSMIIDIPRVNRIPVILGDFLILSLLRPKQSIP